MFGLELDLVIVIQWIIWEVGVYVCDGYFDYGNVFVLFMQGFLNVLLLCSLLLVFGDGCINYCNLVIDVLVDMVIVSWYVYWFNLEFKYLWGSGDLVVLCY